MTAAITAAVIVVVLVVLGITGLIIHRRSSKRTMELAPIYEPDYASFTLRRKDGA